MVGGTLPTCIGTLLCTQEYVRDLVGTQTNKTVIVSTDSSGNAGTGESTGAPFISGSDRYVAFSSLAANLLPPNVDTNGIEDVFEKDLQTQATNRVDLSSGGGQAGGFYARYGVIGDATLPQYPRSCWSALPARRALRFEGESRLATAIRLL